MKRALLLCAAVVSVTGILHGQQSDTVPDWVPGRTPKPDRARAWFPDGTGLEIHTEATGATGTNSAGEIGIRSEKGSGDLVNRVVIDKQNHVLFAYNLEASRGTRPGTVSIRVEPIGAAMETELLNRQGSGLAKLSGKHVPTVAKTREFPSVRIGEALTLDILYNPSTSERIYDVLRPITDPSPAPQHPVVTEVRSHDAISLKDIVAKVNGQAIQAPVSWMIGAVMRIDIPDHGTYVVAAHEPANVPHAIAFQAIAQADGDTLSWTMDGDKIEIASGTNVLTGATRAVLWVYHDRRYRPKDQPNIVRLQAADTAEWLLPNRTAP